MINDECDVENCRNRAVIECERLENNEPTGDYYFVCVDCFNKDKDNLEIVKVEPNEFEKNVFLTDKDIVAYFEELNFQRQNELLMKVNKVLVSKIMEVEE